MKPIPRVFVVLSGLVLMLFHAAPAQPVPPSWLTLYEKSGGMATSRYEQTMEFCRRLADASPWVHLTSFGRSPQGRSLPLLILSRDGAFDPASARRTGKALVLIQSGIHAGEIDGKDASLMLVRDIVIRKMHRDLLDHAIVLFVPIFNVDGHERFGPYNRINQNGPVEMGWRTTAQNLNLNRDYMKADAPEMRAMLRLFSEWLPDLLVDCHVTDGIDFQYDVTYSVEPFPSLDRGVASWIDKKLLPAALPAVEEAGHKVFSYVFPREDNDLSKGLTAGAATPRFSTGYAAIQNRPAVLIETHMLKPYRIRVEATYAFLTGILQAVNLSHAELRAVVLAADRSTAAMSASDQHPFLPLRFGLGKQATTRTFLGIEARTESSAVSGGKKTIYTGNPVTVSVPFYDQVTVEDSISIPLGYVLPPEWTTVTAVLRAHGVRVRTLTRPTTVDVESYEFKNVRFRERPFEGRHIVTYATSPKQEKRAFPAGSLVVPLSQRTAKVIMHLLEPKAPDALVGWGFFDTIFEQKEYAEGYVMEAVADTMLRNNEALRKEYENKLHADSAFAKSPDARLNWLYLRSPWGDPLMNSYPVGRVVTKEAAMLLTAGSKQ